MLMKCARPYQLWLEVQLRLVIIIKWIIFFKLYVPAEEAAGTEGAGPESRAAEAHSVPPGVLPST